MKLAGNIFREGVFIYNDISKFEAALIEFLYSGSRIGAEFLN